MRTIDQWLTCEETGNPFSHCVRCRFPLVELATPWLVNKEFHRDECVLEYAICQGCRDEVSEEFSPESKRSVRRFLENEIEWDERIMEFMLAADLTRRFDACIACRKPRESCSAFGISVLFDEGGMVTVGPLPLMICQSCIERMTANLSTESREVWRKFIATHFDGPPGSNPSLPGSGFPGML